MNVRELIQALAGESDMDSTVYVRLIDDVTGDEKFGDVDGIATFSDSYRPSNMRTCTTLVLGAVGK